MIAQAWHDYLNWWTDLTSFVGANRLHGTARLVTAGVFFATVSLALLAQRLLRK